MGHFLQVLWSLYGDFGILTAVKSRKLWFLIKKIFFTHFLEKYFRFKVEVKVKVEVEVEAEVEVEVEVEAEVEVEVEDQI